MHYLCLKSSSPSLVLKVTVIDSIKPLLGRRGSVFCRIIINITRPPIIAPGNILVNPFMKGPKLLEPPVISTNDYYGFVAKHIYRIIYNTPQRNQSSSKVSFFSTRVDGKSFHIHHFSAISDISFRSNQLWQSELSSKIAMKLACFPH
jgi:hypothetical protein